MKLVLIIAAFSMTACGNDGSGNETTDSGSIMNTINGNVSDGVPNERAGDTNDYSRMNDIIKDSTAKDTVPK
jgi:hypothetical protein